MKAKTKTTKKENRKGLYIAGAIGGLILLFLISFYGTGLVLKISQGTLFAPKDKTATPEDATMTYEELVERVEELESQLAEKDIRIESLEIQLGIDNNGAALSSGVRYVEKTEEPEEGTAEGSAEGATEAPAENSAPVDPPAPQSEATE